METINKWTDNNKLLLKEYILENINCEYKDIVVCGSRLFGGFKPKSDIDIVVYTKEFESQDRFRGYFTGVENKESEYNNFRVTIVFKSDKNIEDDKWTSVNMLYNMPRYSIVNNKMYEGNENHVKHHQGIRALIKEYKGWNVPFDKYLKENKYLIN